MNGIECNSSRSGFEFGPIAIGHYGGAVSTTSRSEGMGFSVSPNSAVSKGGGSDGVV